MSFRFHDTLSDSTLPLPERTPGKTTLYVCGPTVYGFIHVGNGRGPVIFDVLARHLESQGRTVKYVRNYTDVDDKIINVAVAEGEEPHTVAERFIAAYREDTAALGCRVPTVEPRVSEHMGDIVDHIKALIEKGAAYATDEGDVYYDAATFASYGKLSKRTVDLGHAEFGRGKHGAGKRNEHDFALWKHAKPHEPAGARWPSPWGEGRPGWHIECSAMSYAHLGRGFDLHGGGMDLKFPHHENEIAQSEPVHGDPMCGGWMHNGFIEVDVERGAHFPAETSALAQQLFANDPELRKISKSDASRRDSLLAKEGRTQEEEALLAIYRHKAEIACWFQLRRLLGRIDGEAVRLWILGTHYRAPLAFDVQAGDHGAVRFPALEAAEKQCEYLYDTWLKLRARQAVLRAAKHNGTKPSAEAFLTKARADFSAALDEDLGTATALDPLYRVFTRINELCDAKRPAIEDLDLAETTARFMTSILGVAEGDPEAFFARVTARRIALRGLEASHIDGLVQARTDARASKDFAKADALRAELTALGIELRDGATNTTWRAV